MRMTIPGKPAISPRLSVFFTNLPARWMTGRTILRATLTAFTSPVQPSWYVQAHIWIRNRWRVPASLLCAFAALLPMPYLPCPKMEREHGCYRSHPWQHNNFHCTAYFRTHHIYSFTRSLFPDIIKYCRSRFLRRLRQDIRARRRYMSTAASASILTATRCIP